MAQTVKTKDILRRIVPWALEKNINKSKYRGNYKGNRGRIGIVGGARDYSGAPYFASISAMRLGADLAYVICSSTASQSIKNYSPDLIVTPLLDCPDEEEFQKEMECLMMRLHALIIGPGLGRDKLLLDRALTLIESAKKRSMPLIFDADSLLLVNDDPSIIRSYPKAILTPNRVELQRLCQSLFGDKEKKPFDMRNMAEDEIVDMVRRCSSDLKVGILAKGSTDIVADQDGSIMMTDPQSGSSRRCGGQGDITAGLAGVYAYWIEMANKNVDTSNVIERPSQWAGYLAALTTRTVNEIAYGKYQNGMLCSDMIKMIPQALTQLLGSQELSSSAITTTLKNIRYEGLMTSDEISRYARQMTMNEFGPRCQLKLKKSSALIIGAGGLGCPAAVYLAAAGIGRLGIVDDDSVEVSNLHRQVLHNVHKVGWLKTESIKQSLKDINPHVCVETHSIRLDRWNAVKLIERYDMVLDATDNLISRYIINDACVVAKKPLISGAALKMSGQIAVYNYDVNTPCFRCIFPKPPPLESVGSCSENGVLGVLPGVIGIQQALEAIKIGAGLKPAYAGRFVVFDGELGQFRHITLSKRKPNCEACGKHAKLDRDLIDYEQFCFGSSSSTCAKKNKTTTSSDNQNKAKGESNKAPLPVILSPDERISVEQYRGILESGRNHLLIDVRPRNHSDVSRFADALQIPLPEIERKPEESLSLIMSRLTSRNTHEIYVVCRRGIASQQATKRIKDLLVIYKHRGIVVKDIIGGMTTWSSQVDPSYKCV